MRLREQCNAPNVSDDQFAIAEALLAVMPSPNDFPVIYEWAGKDFSGYAPDVAGCVATAKTLPLIRSMLKGALEAHLQWMKDDGDPLAPSDSVTVEMEPDPEFPQPAGYYVIVEKLSITMPRSKTQKPKLAKAKRTAPKRRVLQAA